MKKSLTVNTTIEAGFKKLPHIQIDKMPKIFEKHNEVIEMGFEELPHIPLVECMICHKGFIEKDELSKVKLCSPLCIKRYMNEECLGTRECIFCHNVFSLRPSNIDDEYCSYNCFGKHDQQIWNNHNTKIYRQTEIGKMISSAAGIKRREAKRNIISNWTKEELKNKRMDTKGICCGFERNPHYVGIDELTMDHIYPLMRAYKDFLRTDIKRVYTINDIQFLCRSCNSHKHTKLIIKDGRVN